MRKTISSLVAALLPLLANTAAANVYRCTDSAGKVAYQAQPCAESDQVRAVSTSAVPPARPRDAATGSSRYDIVHIDGGAPAPSAEAPVTAAPGHVGRAARPNAPPAVGASLTVPGRPRVRIEFDLLSTDLRRLPWSNVGPRDGQRNAGAIIGGLRHRHGVGSLAVASNRVEAYTLASNGGTLVWLPKGVSGPEQRLAPPSTLPELSWASGLAWSEKDGVLAIVSTGGEGYFYRYDTRKHRWLDARSLQNRDLLSLAFDAMTRSFVGITEDLELITFDIDGAVKQVRPLKHALGGMSQTESLGLRLAAQGGAVAIVNVQQASVTHIWTYELASGQAQLSYLVGK